ncbi:hypothetical protein KKC1_05240 [Calderihabitans maritimus]|uniref:Uncharacterized protein n=1 Tax=Calderihabitans maritimus TaxID=1246530 RepID=A0A1Z5HPB0_9FIRM|nr:hypothetical protein KKC1_05240 [Calderihabitans maritimus]
MRLVRKPFNCKTCLRNRLQRSNPLEKNLMRDFLTIACVDRLFFLRPAGTKAYG